MRQLQPRQLAAHGPILDAQMVLKVLLDEQPVRRAKQRHQSCVGGVPPQDHHLDHAALFTAVDLGDVGELMNLTPEEPRERRLIDPQSGRGDLDADSIEDGRDAHVPQHAQRE